MTKANLGRKWITLKERAEIAGEIRRPEEGSIFVPAARADELVAQRKAVAASAPVLASDAPPAIRQRKRKPAKAKAKSVQAPAPAPIADPSSSDA